jgi:hypothetical protein
MSITTEWYDDSERIILFSVTGAWTWADLDPQIKKSQGMCASVSHTEPVHAIFDMLAADGLIPRDAILRIGRIAAEDQAPNAGVTVIVTQNRVIHQLFEVAKTLHDRMRSRHSKSVRSVFRLERTIPEALNTLNEIDTMSLQNIV